MVGNAILQANLDVLKGSRATPWPHPTILGSPHAFSSFETDFWPLKRHVVRNRIGWSHRAGWGNPAAFQNGRSSPLKLGVGCLPCLCHVTVCKGKRLGSWLEMEAGENSLSSRCLLEAQKSVLS
uniref:Uncharacterized protein n=1 Tax=Sphaerodactylus townsendi TaxID=933632 RepID=A0ACB8EUQ4_9SAUR